MILFFKLGTLIFDIQALRYPENINSSVGQQAFKCLSATNRRFLKEYLVDQTGSNRMRRDLVAPTNRRV